MESDIRTLLKKGIRRLIGIGNSCPYTIMGKKVVESARGKWGRIDKVSNNRESELISRMRTGRNIALIGIFCPFFWFSLFSGAPTNEVYFNGAHSGIVVAIGLGLMLNAKRTFSKGKRKIEK